MKKQVAIVSGGMDSVTLAYWLREMYPGDVLHLVSFDYGQRHKKELAYAAMCANDLHAQHSVVDLSALTPYLKGSALTDSSVDVPEGHYAAPSMALTVVPNRNAIMLSVATGIAVAEGASHVYTGVHAGDHPIYPDCRPEFIIAMDQAMQLATAGFAPLEFAVVAPFVYMSKADIAAIAFGLEVPLSDGTWSCYNGREHHCGVCGTCVERHEAIVLAGGVDETRYEVEPTLPEAVQS